MRVTLGGKRYELRLVRLQNKFGDVDSPTVPGKQIRIDSRLAGEKQLEILIHEALHALDWRADEFFIDRDARDLARLLWRFGYRKTE